MAWVQISLVSNPDNLERIEEALTEASALAITLMNPEDTPLLIGESPPLEKGGKGGFDRGFLDEPSCPFGAQRGMKIGCKEPNKLGNYRPRM